MIDPVFKGKNVIAEISSTASGKWQNGERDHTQGYVQSVFDPRNDAATRTAQFVPLDAHGDRSKILTVPIQYLVPVHPAIQYEQAVVMDGKRKGSVVVLREATDGKWIVSPLQDPGAGVFELGPDLMVKILGDGA